MTFLSGKHQALLYETHALAPSLPFLMNRSGTSPSPRHLLGSLVLGCVLVGCAPAASHSPGQGSAPSGKAGGEGHGGACAYAGWSAPQPLTGFPAGSIARSSSLAVRAGRGYLVGNDILLYDSLPSPSAPLIAVTRDGKDIGRPAGNFLFMSPRALLGADGTLHMLWTEPGSWRPTVRADWTGTLMNTGSLWHATYMPKQGWDPAGRVYAASQVWFDVGTGDITLDPAGGLQALLGDDSTRALMHLTRNGNTWRAGPIPGIGLPVYSSIAVDSAGRVYVAYVAPDRSVQRDANSVFFVQSPDGGRTWLPPRLISRSGNAQATRIHALATPGGTVHLVWAQNVSGGIVPEVIRHVVSRDAGGTWSAAEDIDVPDGLGSTQAALDLCGAVHVTHEAVVEDETGQEERGRIWYARWDGAWSALEQPFGELNSTEAALAADPDGTLHLVWFVVRPGATPHETTFMPVQSHLQVTR